LGLSFLTDVPWIAEFRDPLVEVPSLDPGKDSRSIKIRKTAEKMVVKYADQIVWGDGIQIEDGYFKETYPKVTSKKFYKLPFQGFELEKFQNAGTKNFDEFTITYAGSFYEGWREPYRFLDGVSAYLEEEGDDIRVQFYGDWNQDYQTYVEEKNLEDIVVTHDRVTHDQIIPVLKGSDILLYLGGDDPDNRLNVPSKVYDYIGARKPILTVVDSSFRVADVIRDNELGVVADPAEQQEIADSIRRIRIGEFEYAPDEEVFEKFRIEHKMEVLAEVLDAVKDGRVYNPTGSKR
jgi:glycosyltransferase involved in cell wall biosynthesis